MGRAPRRLLFPVVLVVSLSPDDRRLDEEGVRLRFRRR